MRYFKLTIQYDGTNYHGFQIQPNVPTIQSVLEETLSALLKCDIHVTGCSRTDAGVHAKKYVCNFSADCHIPAEKLPVALAGKLPRDIIACQCQEVDKSFHARRCAMCKTYRYRIDTSQFGDVFFNRFSWHHAREMDINLMNKACSYVVGKRDFASFMAAGSQVIDTVRNVIDLYVEKNYNFVDIYITADGFLYNMVRIIVGTLVNIGLKRYPPEYMNDIINAKDRSLAGFTAPPEGLMLYDIVY